MYIACALQFEIRRPQLIPIERGALLYLDPGPWRVFALTGGEYILSKEFENMPNAEEITRCVRRTIAEATAPARKTHSEGSDSEFLQVIALFVIAFAAVFAYFQSHT